MVSGEQRALRARHLAERYPHAREVLELYARAVLSKPEALRQLLIEHAPAALAEAAREKREPAVSFMERLHARVCTSHTPLLGVLRPEGDGAAFLLFCDTCKEEYSFPREACPHCEAGEIAWYKNETIPHIQTRVCESCRRYLQVIDMGREPRAVAEVDELVALPMDLWAVEHGLEKTPPNLAGV